MLAFECGRRCNDTQHGAIHCDDCVRCSAPLGVTFYFIPNYCSAEVEEEHKERAKKERKRFMHYDGGGAHTLMALNGPEVATRWVNERRRTW